MGSRTAWVVGVVAVLINACAVALSMLNEARGGTEFELVDYIWSLSFLTFPLVGSFIASRRPESPIGWLLCAATMPWLLTLALSSYVEYAVLIAPGTVPLGLAAGWLSTWVAWPGWFCAILLLLLFPSGHLRSRRWMTVVIIAALSTAGIAFHLATRVEIASSEFGAERPGVSNPLAVRSGAALIRTISDLSGVGLLVAVALAFFSLILRLRRSRGEERQQVKLFVFGIATFIGMVVFLTIFSSIGFSTAGSVLLALGIAAIPTSIAVAVLRYRLYDIDLVINRALVYGALTALLGLAYLGLVVLLQAATSPITPESDLTVAGSTLAVAALFRPLRRGIQGFIDRRFYRARYDAAETLDLFTARLRDQVDLESLTDELVGVVGTTMHPAHASLWLRAEQH